MPALADNPVVAWPGQECQVGQGGTHVGGAVYRLVGRKVHFNVGNIHLQPIITLLLPVRWLPSLTRHHLSRKTHKIDNCISGTDPCTNWLHVGVVGDRGRALSGWAGRVLSGRAGVGS